MDEKSSSGNELDMFLNVNHDNIVRYFDHFHMRIGDENHTFLITEFCEVNENLSLLSFTHSYK